MGKMGKRACICIVILMLTAQIFYRFYDLYFLIELTLRVWDLCGFKGIHA